MLPLAAVHTLGNLLTNVSLGHVAVSFTHTIKARPLLHPGCAALAVLLPSLQVALPSLRSSAPLKHLLSTGATQERHREAG